MSEFYTRLTLERERAGQPDTAEYDACVRETVDELVTRETTSSHPGMLLGKIQSGKTRAFLGIIALAFDKGFDVAIVLTKGTKTLGNQTVSRIARDFRDYVATTTGGALAVTNDGSVTTTGH